MPSGWRLKVLRGPYRSTPPLALSNGQTTGSLSIVGLGVFIMLCYGIGVTLEAIKSICHPYRDWETNTYRDWETS